MSKMTTQGDAPSLIRKAALRRRPKDSMFVSNWIGDIKPFWDVMELLSAQDAQQFYRAEDDQKRMFLLFVAEAIKGESAK